MSFYSKLPALLLCLFVLTGCTTMTMNAKIPNQEELSKNNYGQPLTIDYEKLIKEYFSSNLKDPDSAKYEFSKPTPFWFRENAMNGSKEYFGYAVTVMVNAKNGFGGYTGNQPYSFIFRDNSLVRMLTPEEIETISINQKPLF